MTDYVGSLSDNYFPVPNHQKDPVVESLLTESLISDISAQTPRIKIGNAQSSLHRFKGKITLIAGKASDMLVAHQNRIAGIHSTKAAKAAALLLTVIKVAITVTPLMAACPPMGFVILGSMILAPILFLGIRSGIEKYAANKFSFPLEGTKQEIQKCIDLRYEFVMKQLGRLSTAGQITGWVMNPLGNLIGAIILKLGDVAQQQIVKKWGVEGKGVQTAICCFEGFKFLGFHAGKLLVPTLLTTPVQMLARRIKSYKLGVPSGMPKKVFIREEGVINGQKIGDRTYEELLWKSYHNIQASNATDTRNPLGQLASQWLANQQIRPLQAAQDSNVTAFEIDLITDRNGNIVMTHGGLPLGNAAETREFFTTLANNLNQNNGRMVSFHIDNVGKLPMAKFNSYFQSIHADNMNGQSGGGPSLVDLMAKPNKEGRYTLTMEEYYNRGERAFVNVSNRGQHNVDWVANDSRTTTAYNLNFRPQEVFDRASEIADKSTDYLDHIKIPFQSNMGNFTATGSTDELINMRLGSFMKELLSQHRTLKGGVLNLDYADSHTEDLDAMIKVWNETAPAQRGDLLDLWDHQGHVDIQASLTHDALNIVARRMFLSTFLRMQDPGFNLRGDAVNPLGDTGDMTHLLKPKKSRESLFHSDLYRGWNTRFKINLKSSSDSKEIPPDALKTVAALVKTGKTKENEQHFHVARALLKSHFKSYEKKFHFLKLLMKKHPREFETYVEFLNLAAIEMNAPTHTKKAKRAKEDMKKELQIVVDIMEKTGERERFKLLLACKTQIDFLD